MASKKDLFITEKIKGCCLTDHVAENWQNMPEDVKVELFIALANFCRKVHDAGISLPDLYLWHIYMLDGVPGFAIIDLHRMKSRASGTNDRIRNLGAFLFSLSPDYFDDKIKEAFLNAYAADNFKGDKLSFFRRVKNRCKVLENRRRRQKY